MGAKLLQLVCAGAANEGAWLNGRGMLPRVHAGWRVFPLGEQRFDLNCTGQTADHLGAGRIDESA
jgi:hypothetical protein